MNESDPRSNLHYLGSSENNWIHLTFIDLYVPKRQEF